MLKPTLCFMLVAGCWASVAVAQTQTQTQAQAPQQQFIYKWTDSQGQIQYSELAPPPGVQYETVRRPAGAEQNPEAAARNLSKEQADLAKPVSYTHLDVYKRQGQNRLEVDGQ